MDAGPLRKDRHDDHGPAGDRCTEAGRLRLHGRHRPVTTIALAGDTMLGRGVAAQLRERGPASLFGQRLLETVRAIDGMILNLECCISERGRPFPGRRFAFRAPPNAIDALHLLGVRAVTLANNHVLDFGVDALTDTLRLLSDGGISTAGAGANAAEARTIVDVAFPDLTVQLLSFTDHPPEYEATDSRPGVALAELEKSTPPWLLDAVRAATTRPGLLLVSPHWGPNMVESPMHYVRRAAKELREAGAHVIAGHSAHVFHGVAHRTVFDLGDLIDDYASGPLHNELGCLWLLTVEAGVPRRLEAVPIHVDYCFTELASEADARWIAGRLTRACRQLGTDVAADDGRLVIAAFD